MAKSFESKAVRVLARSGSVRSTVPAPIAALLGVEPGDTLVWEVEPGSGRIVVTRKSDTGSAKSIRERVPSRKLSSRS